MRDNSVPFIGLSKDFLPTPSLIVDEDRLGENLERMARFFADKPAKLRPHVKSHKCSALALRQVQAGAIGVTAATVEEAEAMAAGGVRDILIANQVMNRFWVDRLVTLASVCDLKVAVDSERFATLLSTAAQGQAAEVGVVIEVNVGMDRCGVPPGQVACALAQRVASTSGLRFRGFMGYEGHAVGVEDPASRAEACRVAMDLLVSTVDLARSQGLLVEIVSAGGTGTYDIAGNFPGVTEVQAGSYALMDLQYRRVRSEFQPALRVLSTVISRPSQTRAVADAGLKAMSTEFGTPQVVAPEGVRLIDLSEEHALLEVDEGSALCPGDRVEFLPTHSCTTVPLHACMFLTKRDLVREVWVIDGRRGFQTQEASAPSSVPARGGR